MDLHLKSNICYDTEHEMVTAVATVIGLHHPLTRQGSAAPRLLPLSLTAQYVGSRGARLLRESHCRVWGGEADLKSQKHWQL